jgi:hypothetical protein
MKALKVFSGSKKARKSLNTGHKFEIRNLLQYYNHFDSHPFGKHF